MYLEFLVEERSMEEALYTLVPRALGESAEVNVRLYQGKQDLLTNLATRLRGYRHWLPKDARIIVLIDEDRQDCVALKAELEKIAHESGLVTRSQPAPDGTFQVVNRVVIEELEAWFFGDPVALHTAFPRLPATLGESSAYRNPDAIKGGTWEALRRVLQRAGYYPDGVR